MTKDGSQQYFDWFKYEFWRFVFIQQEVAKLAHDGDRVPADAEGRELQSRCREGENRGSQSGNGQVKLVKLLKGLERAARRGPPFCPLLAQSGHP